MARQFTIPEKEIVDDQTTPDYSTIGLWSDTDVNSRIIEIINQ